LVNIDQTSPLIFRRASREQAFEIDRKKQRQHLYRHRRLDLRAVRGAGDPKAHAGEGAGLRRRIDPIEINGTYYGSQKPESFRKWARECPTDLCSLADRASRPIAVRWRKPRSVKRFYDPGVLELGDRLGRAVAVRADQKFDEADFGKFLELLPRKLGDARCVTVEVRHDSFCVPEFIALLRKFETPRRVRRTRQISRDRRCRQRHLPCGCRRQ
jgi:hypothetical protein